MNIPFYPLSVRLRRLQAALCLVAALLLAAACSTDDDGLRYGIEPGSGEYVPTGAVTARMEVPRSLTDGSTLLVTHYVQSGGRQVMNYCLEYDKAKLHSRWVAFRFDGDTRASNVSRSDDPFADDPELPASLHIGSSGFGGSYNRGHLCASADRKFSTEANEQTFYMSNMSPQLGSFNQGYWITLEGLVQDKGRNRSFADTLYVVKGGTVRDGQLNGYVTRTGGKRVAVPKYYFMALLRVKNGQYGSIGFWMEHKEYGYGYGHQAPLSVIATHAVTVNELEELSGIDFFPNLPDAIEESVESQLQPAGWGL